MFEAKSIFLSMLVLLTINLVGCREDSLQDGRQPRQSSADKSDEKNNSKNKTANDQIQDDEEEGKDLESPEPDVLPDTTPTVRTSQGSGGPLGMNEISFVDSSGLESSYKINAPPDISLEKHYGLHIHLHGDGGGGYRDFPNQLTKFEMIGVTVRAPNTNLQWGRQQGGAHANYLKELIEDEIVKKYNIDLDKIFFSGVSGGAYFLSGNFIPTYGQLYNSGAILLCGGERPRVNFSEPAMLTNFRIHWQVTAGERQDITNSINASIDSYKAAFDALNGTKAGDQALIQTSETIGDGGHCEFDGQPYTPGIQSMLDRRFEVILKKGPVAASPP